MQRCHIGVCKIEMCSWATLRFHKCDVIFVRKAETYFWLKKGFIQFAFERGKTLLESQYSLYASLSLHPTRIMLEVTK